MEQNESWSESFAKSIGRRVAYYRERGTDERGRKLTAQALADRCGELGHPLDRSVIAKLEKGHRAHVTVADWLVLARALGVAPVQLLMPFGIGDPTELLPGEDVDSVGAAKWISGEDGFPVDGIDPTEDRWYLPSGTWKTGAEPVTLCRRHRSLVQQWRERSAAVRVSWRQLQEEDTGAARDWNQMLEQRLSLVEASLREIRDRMRELDLNLPWISDEIAVSIGEDV